MAGTFESVLLVPSPSATTLSILLRRSIARIPFPLLFVAGACVGIFVASFVVAISRGSAPRQTISFSPPPMALTAPAWTPPVITITPAPVEAVAPAPIATPAPASHLKKVATLPRAERRAPAKPRGDLLAAGL